MRSIQISNNLLQNYHTFLLFLLTYFIQRRRRLFKTTLTLENAIRALAQEGVICQLIPKTYNSPAAKGIQTRL